MAPEECIQLTNGLRLPMVGLGTSHSGGCSLDAVVFALQKSGYRLIDTAKRYATEQLVGDAIKLSGVDRSDVIVQTKIWPADYGYQSVRSAFIQSLKRLQTDYIDVLLLHWPEVSSSQQRRKWDLIDESWRALEILNDEERIRAIGVSNWTVDDMDMTVERWSQTPAINQIEFHPFQQPKKLINYCRDRDIVVQGYCPLGKGQLLQEPVVLDIANKLKKTPAQVLIRWAVEQRVPVVPKSTKEERVKENISIFDFRLPDEDRFLLDSMHDGRRFVDATSIRSKLDQARPDGYKLIEATSCSLDRLSTGRPGQLVS